jgi:hypothetical protein
MIDSESNAYGISHGGRAAEREFMSLTGAVLAPQASIGDVLFEGYPIEVKRATSNTLNQVRAVKYIPLAALDVRTHTWYVVPAHVIVAQVARKTRGQHTENPFESATLSLANLKHYKVEDSEELPMRTLDAIDQSSQYPKLKAAMQQALADSRALADEHLNRVRQVLAEAGLAP